MISAWENFHFATLELVRSTPIKQRLICAYRRHLASRRRRSTARRSARIVLAGHAQPWPACSRLRGEDAVAASVRKMSNQEADDCAALIVEIFGLMCTARMRMRRAERIRGSAAQRRVRCIAAEFDVPVLTAAN